MVEITHTSFVDLEPFQEGLTYFLILISYFSGDLPAVIILLKKLSSPINIP